MAILFVLAKTDVKDAIVNQTDLTLFQMKGPTR